MLKKDPILASVLSRNISGYPHHQLFPGEFSQASSCELSALPSIQLQDDVSSVDGVIFFFGSTVAQGKFSL